MTRHLSYSQVACYSQCNYKWSIEYKKGIVPRIQKKAPHLGTLVHLGIHNLLMTKGDKKHVKTLVTQEINNYIDLVRELPLYQIQEIEDMGKLAVRLANRTYNKVILEFDPMVIDGKIASEYQLTHPMMDLVKRTVFSGTIDLLAYEKGTKDLWLIDWKVREAFQDETEEELNIQFAGYQYLLKEKGIQTKGSIGFQIRNKMPKTPELLKNGQMSRAEIMTDWKTYKKALINNNLKVKDYAEMEEKLAYKVFFQLNKDYRPSHIVNRYWAYIIRPMILNTPEIYDYGATVHHPRRMTVLNCNGCQHRDLCLMDLRGDDTKDFIKHNYVKNSYLNQYEEV